MSNAQSSAPRRTFLAVACLGASLAPALAVAQTADDQASAKQRNLGSVVVTDTAIDDNKGPLARPQSLKFTQPVIDTPQTIQIIDKDTFNQQGATTLTEALRNTPGVGTFYVGENGSTSTGDALYMRGFDISSSIFVDGIRDIGSISRDVFNIDQIEVEKGPAGTDNGRTAPAGAINLVTKHALATNAIGGILTAGTDGQKRITADINEKLVPSGNIALRLNALWQDSDVAGRDHVNNQRVGLAPSIGVGLNGPTRFYVNLFYVKQDNVPDGGVSTVGLPGWSPQAGQSALIGHPVDPTNFYGTRADHDHVEAKMATAQFEHDFSSTVKLTNITRWGRTDEDYLLTSFMTPTVGSNPADLSTYTIARSNANVKDAKNEIVTDQLALHADVATGGISHALVLGVEGTREEQKSYGVTATSALTAANLYNPSWNNAGTISLTRNGAATRGVTKTLSAYAFDTAKFFDSKLLLTGGVRFDHYKTSYDATAVCGGTGRTVVACGTQPTGSVVPTADLKTKDTLFNWKVGAVYKPISPVSVYVDYALSQQPPGGSTFALSTSTTSLDNPNLDPEKAKTLEGGVKASLFHDRLLATAAVFRTVTHNEIDSTNLDAAGNPTQTGRKLVKGIEFNLSGNITTNWSVLLGYTIQKAKIDQGANVAQDGTPNLTYTPGDAFTSWTTYRLPFGVTIGGGVRYTDGLHRGTDGAVGTPAFTKSWTVLDAIASYALTKSISLRLNAYNLFDKKYVQGINKSGYRYTPGTPRTFLFSADVKL